MRNVTTVSDVLAKDANSFGLIRVILAGSVIVSHSWSIGGFGVEPLYAFSSGVSLGMAAVTGFFALSGILVGLSAEKATAAIYFANRLGRILPAYWVCLVVSALLFGVLICLIRGVDVRYGLVSPNNESAWTYIVNNFPLSASQYKLGHALDGLPYPFAINGSLWSLPYEFACYLAIFAVVKWRAAAKQGSAVILLIAAISIFLAIVSSIPGSVSGNIAVPILGILGSKLFFNLWLVFLMGAILAMFRERIIVTRGLTIAAALITVATLPLGVFWPVGCLTLPYMMLAIANYLPNKFRRVGASVDISYGLYLYGFPASQLLVATFGPERLGGGIALAVGTLVLCVPLSAMSWTFVERPFLTSRTRPKTSGGTVTGLRQPGKGKTTRGR